MSNRKCTNCNCPCLLVSVGCIKDQLNPFTPMTDDDRVRKAIDLATLRYIRPVLKEACFTAICAALDASEIPSGQEGHATLPTHFQTFIDTYAIPIISEAATALYIENYGFDQLSIQKKGEEADEYIKRKFAGANAAKQDFKEWYELEDTKKLFDCLPDTTETTTCVEDPVGIDTDFGAFAASTKYPSNLRDGDRPKGYI